MSTLPLYVIPRRCMGGVIMLFLPDAPANPGNILSYEHMGQHGEASMEYYWGSRPVPPHQRKELQALLREYRAKLDKSEHL